MSGKLLLIIALTLSLASCNKKSDSSSTVEEVNVNDLVNSGPVSAGTNKIITLPVNSVSLAGTSSNVQTTTKFLWTQTLGARAKIESPTTPTTKISNLLEGVYTFKISRTDGTETISDDVNVTVKAQVTTTPPSVPTTPTVPTAPTVPTIPTVPTTPTVPPIADGDVSVDAGKISLWKRAGTYDSAVFLPAEYGKDPNRLFPMILSLHGLNGTVLNTAHTAVGGLKTGYIKQVWGTTLAKTYPAIVVAPNWAPAGSTASGLWEHAKLRQTILDAIKKYKVDANKVVVTGLSAGSIGTQELVKNSKDLLAGAMPAAYAPVMSDPCQMADLPTWVFGNTSDSYFNSASWTTYQGKVQSCGNYIHEFTLTIYTNTCGHGCWDSHWAKPEVQDWLINQTR
jgi:predicted esterase